MKKYISLFPPEVRKGEEPSAASLAEATKTNADRDEVKRWVREQMESGDLPSEPEVEHHGGGSRAQKWPQSASAHADAEKPVDTDAQEDDFFGDSDKE